jgi:selenocysteine-specific elongation factor
VLSAFHAENPDLQGMGCERLRLRLEPRLSAPAFAAALQSLARLGEVAIDGAWVRLPGHQARLTTEHEALWARIRPLLSGQERFRPPRVRDIVGVLGVPEVGVRRLLKLACRMGRVDEVAHDHFFLRDAVAEMVEIARELAQRAEGGQFTAAQLRDRLDNGRKVAIQILEFFDRHGVTLRRGDLRRINPHRLDLFGRPAAEAKSATAHPGRESSPVGRPDFKSGKGREPVLGGFDPHSLPPSRRGWR